MFTQGDLEVSKDAVPDGVTQVTIYAAGSGNRVATVFEAEYIDLFAAAPDIFDALRDALYALDPTAALLERGHTGRMDSELAIKKARAAIARATGK